MQIKEALEYWKFRYNRTKYYNDIHWEASERREHEEYVEALKTAIEALEKQIPKKIDYQKVDDIIVRFCPSCKVRFLRWGHKFCGECGQRLDWSDES